MSDMSETSEREHVLRDIEEFLRFTDWMFRPGPRRKPIAHDGDQGEQPVRPADAVGVGAEVTGADEVASEEASR